MGKGAIKRSLIAASTWVLLANVVASGAELITLEKANQAYREGKYEEAATHLQTVLAQYPRDRVAVNDLGRIFFLQRKYSDSIAASQRVLGIDPEDLQAHYNLMLSYQGMGDPDKAKHEQQLYLRFKADESAQALTGGYRQTHPEDNNERQLIHQHESAPAETTSAKPARRLPAKRASSNHSSPDGE